MKFSVFLLCLFAFSRFQVIAGDFLEPATGFEIEKIAVELKEKVKESATPDEAVEALRKIVVDNGSATVARLAAIELLGEYPTESSIAVLIENISFRDKPSVYAPAHGSLRRIGDVAIPGILKAIQVSVEQKAGKERKADLVRALMAIKTDSYPAWIKEKFSSFDPEVQRTISVYSLQW